MTDREPATGDTIRLGSTIKTDLQRAYEALSEKKDRYDKYFKYYDGDAPTPYASLRLKKVFEGLDVNIQENWAAVVINAMADRINLEDLETDGGGSERIKELVDETELLLESDDAMLAALITGEGFLFVWKDEGEDDIEVYNHDPRMCHVFYDPNKPRVKLFGCKWWYNDDVQRVYLNLYYPDRIEHYASLEECVNHDTDEVELTGWMDFDRDPEREEDERNPYGIVPIFHFRTGRRKAISQLKDAIPLQDAINMAVINMAVNGEYSSAPQKYVITNGEINGRLRNSPEIIWELPAGDGAGQATSVGQFEATQMRNFIDQITHYTNALSIITRTPRHYFEAAGAPSGESLIIQESPLVKKCQDIIARFKVEYRALGVFLMSLAGSKIEPAKLKPKFSDPQSVQPITQQEVDSKKAATIETKQRIGISRNKALKELGYTDEEIETMDKEKEEEAEKAQEQMMKQMEAGGPGFGLPGGSGGLDKDGQPVKPLAGAAAVTAAVAGKVKPSAKETKPPQA